MAADQEKNVFEKAWQGTVDISKGVVDGAVNAPGNVLEGAKTAVTDPVKFANDSKDNVVAAGKGAVDISSGAVTGTLDMGKQGLEMTADGAKKAGEFANEGVSKAGSMAMDGVNMTTGMADKLMGGFGDTFDKLGVNKGFQSVLSLGEELDTSDESLEKQFASIDADSSGKVSEAEMKEFIIKFYGKALDDGLMSKMMTAADTNKDGEIDLDEFKVIMRAGPEKEPKNMLENGVGFAAGLVGGVAVGAMSVGGGVVDGAKTVGGGAFEGVTAVGGGALKMATDAPGNVLEGAKTAVTDPVKFANDAKDNTIAAGKGAVDMTTEGVSKAGGMAMDGIKISTEKASAMMGGFGATFDKLGVNAGFQSVMSLGQELDTSDESLAKQFASIDADSSGKVSEAEMKEFIVKFYGQALEPSLVEKMMNAADTNKDGEIDLDEFKIIMRAGPEKKDFMSSVMQTFSCTKAR